MQRLGWMVALVVVAVACGTAGDMVGEMLDSGVPDAGAQPGVLTLACDLSYTNPSGFERRYASASAADLPGAFTAFGCDPVDEQGEPIQRTLCSNNDSSCPSNSNVVCQAVGQGHENPLWMEDGSFWFDCGTVGATDRYTSIRVLR